MKSYRGNMGSGKSVPRSGTYGFFHAHSSAHQITLLKVESFLSVRSVRILSSLF